MSDIVGGGMSDKGGVSDIRTRIAKALTASAAIRGLPRQETDMRFMADAVIADLEAAGYVMVPKSQTLTQQVNPSYRPRLVANRDCTPLELPAGWKPKLVQCIYCDYEGTPEELTTQHLNECP